MRWRSSWDSRSSSLRSALRSAPPGSSCSTTASGSAASAGPPSWALGPFLAFFKRYRPFIPVVERAAGVVLVVVGVLVFTNYYVVLNAWAISLTPDWLLKRL